MAQSPCPINGCAKFGNKACARGKCSVHCLTDSGCKVHEPDTAQASQHSCPTSSTPAPPSLAATPPSDITITTSDALSIDPQLGGEQRHSTPTIPSTPSTSVSFLTPVASGSSTHLPLSPITPVPLHAHGLVASSSAQPSTPSTSTIFATPRASTSAHLLPTPITPVGKPRHTSKFNLTPCMVNSLAVLYHRQEKQLDDSKVREEEKKEQRRRERREVTVHCWLKDDKKPAHEVLISDDGPTRFMFTEDHLRTLDIINGAAPTTTAHFKIYNPDTDYFYGATTGHLVAISAGQQLFVAAASLRDFTALRPLISKYSAPHPTHHLRNNLTGERSAVRSQCHSKILAAADALHSSPSPPQVQRQHVPPRPIAPHSTLGPLDTTGANATSKTSRKRTFSTIKAEDSVIGLSDNGLTLPEGLKGLVFTLSDDSSEAEEAKAKGKQPETQLETRLRHASSIFSNSSDSDSAVLSESRLGSDFSLTAADDLSQFLR